MAPNIQYLFYYTSITCFEYHYYLATKKRAFRDHVVATGGHFPMEYFPDASKDVFRELLNV